MATKGGSENVLIKPVYDGHTLPGIQHVAGDGLSVISIKVPHQNCKFTADLSTKQPCISCAQGIQARNSYWNLQKPDLRKVKGLECFTTESVTKLLQAHNPKNAGKNTYRKRILRLLESIVSKKPKVSTSQQLLTQTTESWPINMCVLSSICEEMEVNQSDLINSQEEMKILIKQREKLDSHHADILLPQNINPSKQDITAGSSQLPMDTVYTLSSPSLLADSIENALVNISDAFNQTNGDSGLHELSSRFEVQGLKIKEAQEMSLPTNILSGFKLEKKQPLAQLNVLSHPSDVADIDKLELLTSKEINTVASDLRREKDKHEKLNSHLTLLGDSMNQYTEDFFKNHSEEIVDSIFSKLFQDIENIEDTIRCYEKPVLMPEQKFDNAHTLNNNIIKQVNSISKFSILNEDMKIPQELLEKVLQFEITKNQSIMNLTDNNELNKNNELESIQKINYLADTKVFYKDNCIDGPSQISNTPTSTSRHDNVEDTESFKTEHSCNVKCLDTTFSEKYLSSVSEMSLKQAKFRPDFFSETIYYKELSNHYKQESLSSNAEIPPRTLNTASEPENVVHLVKTFLSGAHFPTNDNMPSSIIEMASEEDYEQYVKQWNIFEQESMQYFIDLNQYQDRRKLVNQYNNSSDKFIKNNYDTKHKIQYAKNTIYPSQDNEDIANAECLHKSSIFIQSVSPNNLDKMGNESISDTLITKKSEEQNEASDNSYLSVSGDDLKSPKTSMASIEKHNTQFSSEPKVLAKNMSLANMHDLHSNNCQSRLVTAPDFNSNTPGETNSKLVFSSPHIQLNMTNPLLNGNRK